VKNQRRKRYIVTTKYVSVKQYEVLAINADVAKELVKIGHRAGLINVEETFNVENAFRKEKL
jgi:predicted CoA-binding protein